MPAGLFPTWVDYAMAVVVLLSSAIILRQYVQEMGKERGPPFIHDSLSIPFTDDEGVDE